MVAKKKIKILHAIRQGMIGGGESHVLDLVSMLNSEDYESIVLSFTYGPMVDRLEHMGIRTYVIETERAFDFSKWNLVKGVLIKERVDIVHAHGTRANSNVFKSAKDLGIPLIYTVHGWSFHPNQNFIVRNLRMFGERFLVSKSDITLCVSENNLNDAEKKFKIKNAQVIKLGINLKKFDPSQTYPSLKSELHINGNTLLVGYIVRMTIQKDPFTLVKAIALLPQNLDVKFLFVGSGDLKEAVIQLAKDLNVYEQIIFMDFRQDVPNLLNAIDIYCLPSLWEGLPLGMLEAMAMRKAVIVTAIDGAKEVIRNNENGLLIPTQNPQILADNISKLVNDKKLRDKIGIAAAQTIESDFNIFKMTSKIEGVYQNIYNK